MFYVVILIFGGGLNMVCLLQDMVESGYVVKFVLVLVNDFVVDGFVKVVVQGIVMLVVDYCDFKGDCVGFEVVID